MIFKDVPYEDNNYSVIIIRQDLYLGGIRTMEAGLSRL